MTLYHFTAGQHIEKIRAEGLTKGAFPRSINPRTGAVVMVGGYQWLTRERSFDQPWAALGSLPITRNAWRITVAIPLEARRHCAHWPALCARISGLQVADYFNAIPGSSDWFVYHGRIPPSWFLAVERNNEGRINPFDLLEGAQ